MYKHWFDSNLGSSVRHTARSNHLSHSVSYSHSGLAFRLSFVLHKVASILINPFCFCPNQEHRSRHLNSVLFQCGGHRSNSTGKTRKLNYGEYEKS